MNGVEAKIALYKLYLDTAEKVSDRRNAANTWMLSVNSAVVALYGYLGKDGAIAAEPDRNIWLWAIPAAGVLVCLAWAALLDSYRKLNAAKFRVIQEMEHSFEHRMFTDEWRYTKEMGKRSLSRVERWIPWSFALLYLCILATRLLI